MNPRSPRLWIGLCSALVVLLVAFVDMGRKSPGPLTSVHQAVEGLSSSCGDCHGGFLSGMRSACLECHARIGEQMELGRGLHGVLAQELVSRCGTCHGEHHGAGFAMVGTQSFALAGVPDPERFDHRLVGFAMDGAHLELACNECHQDAEVEVLPPGHFRYGGLSQACDACHEDPHAGRMEVGCVDCHGQTDWDELFSQGHERVLPLAGGHAALNCRACHAEGERHALEVVGGGGPRPAARACLDCHASPHAEGFLAGTSAVLGLQAAASCGGCHLAAHESFRAEDLTVDARLHACSGFGLGEPHAALSCAACHDPEHDEFELRYPGRAPEQCSLCHADPHEDQFAVGPFSQGECTSCHAPHEWDPPAFGADEHALASLPLTGAHLEADCHACHEIVGGGARVFRGTPSDCDICHADAHRHFFAPFEAELARTKHGACAHCHGTASFAQLPAAGFDHARFAAFPIRGAHAQESCEVCHQPRDEPDAFGRRFGFVADGFGAVAGCAGCHEDPHGGAFDGPDQPLRVDDRAGCARCHVEVSFRVFEQDFDHARWTGFVLQDAHAAVGCTDCHRPKDEPDEFGLTWGPAPGTACSDCHADPHGGQFVDREGLGDCSRCHSPTSFADTAFRHDWDSTFALGEAHRQLACAACHPLVPHAGGEIVRYKPLKSDCIDCHGLHEGQLLRNRRRGK